MTTTEASNCMYDMSYIYVLSIRRKSFTLFSMVSIVDVSGLIKCLDLIKF